MADRKNANGATAVCPCPATCEKLMGQMRTPEYCRLVSVSGKRTAPWWLKPGRSVKRSAAAVEMAAPTTPRTAPIWVKLRVRAVMMNSL